MCQAALQTDCNAAIMEESALYIQPGMQGEEWEYKEEASEGTQTRRKGVFETTAEEKRYE